MTGSSALGLSGDHERGQRQTRRASLGLLLSSRTLLTACSPLVSVTRAVTFVGGQEGHHGRDIGIVIDGGLQ
jgi:hypothetical protein